MRFTNLFGGFATRQNDVASPPSGAPIALAAPEVSGAAGGYVLPPGSLRLWTRDGSTPRCANALWHTAAPGDYLPPTPASGIPAALLGFTNGVRSVTCYAEAVRPSDEQGDIRIVFEVQPDERASVSAADAVRLTAVRFGLVPDYDRDGVIDCHDEAQAATNRIMRWWINDDDNGTDISEGDNDVPGQGHGLTLVSNDTQWPDSATVDGRCDLLDFFPLWLDVGNLLAMLPQDGTTTVCLRQEDGALRAVYTDLRAADAGSYLVSAVANCGPDFAQATHEARTFLIDAADVVLSPAFVNRIVADPRKGVLLVEGCAETQKPLVLEVLRDGVRIMVVELPLSVSGVEDMYRWINLRPDAANYFPSRSNAPPNRPDGECMDKTVFLAHGFLVSKEGARGWASECFKRLYQSGLAAKFCGMSWRADAGTSADYYLNVQNARDTAAQLAPIVNAMPCEKVWMAHSLGNMLSGYAIADHGMNVGKYFALNAAVASEAYDIATVDETESAMNHMRHANWAGYSNRTWASSWFKLFPSGDDRARLTWRNRFTNVLDRTQLYNFWSSGDEVLEIATDGTPFLIEFLSPWGDSRQYTWHKQELYKGRNVIYGTGWAGWGFEYPTWQTAAGANASTDDALRQYPIFKRDPGFMFAGVIEQANVDDILIKEIPALSWPVGRNAIRLGYGDVVSIDMNKDTDDPDGIERPNNWPVDDTYGNRWLHSQLIYVAHFYAHKLYEKFIEIGGLK